MNKDVFLLKKQSLISTLNLIKENNELSSDDLSSLRTIFDILEKYNYENRNKVKGLLTRTIIDSLELDYSIGEKIIFFDQNIQ